MPPSPARIPEPSSTPSSFHGGISFTPCTRTVFISNGRASTCRQRSSFMHPSVMAPATSTTARWSFTHPILPFSTKPHFQSAPTTTKTNVKAFLHQPSPTSTSQRPNQPTNHPYLPYFFTSSILYLNEARDLGLNSFGDKIHLYWTGDHLPPEELNRHRGRGRSSMHFFYT